jgi:hypothetical protein
MGLLLFDAGTVIPARVDGFLGNSLVEEGSKA